MPQVARIGDTLSGHGCFGGHVLASGSSNVKCNGIPISRVSDSTTPHSCVSTHSSTQATGSSTIKINGLAVARIGDSISCGSINTGGSPNVRFG